MRTRLGLALLIATSLAHATVTWKFATGYRAESFHTQNLIRFADEVRVATRGQLVIEVHPDNALYKLVEIPVAVKNQRIQGGETIMTNLTKEVPVAGADAVPFVVSSYGDARRLWQYQRPLVEKHLAQRGLSLLYAVPWPPQGLYSTRPIVGSNDFKGTRMRTYNATTVRIAELLGAIPVDVAMVDVGKALAQGQIDNMITSAVTGVENRVWDRLRYYYEINAWFPKNVVFVSSKALAALPPEQRRAVGLAAEAAERRGWTMSEQAAAESTETLRSNGVKVEPIAPFFIDEIKRLGERFSREWVRSVGHEATDIFIPYYTRREG